VTIAGIGFAGLIIAVIGVSIGACVQSALGFGLGLISAPVLALIDLRFVPGPLIFLGMTIAMLVAHRERSSLDISAVKWAIFGRIPGSVLGSLAVVALADRWLAVLLGVTLLAAVIASVAGVRVPLNARTLFGAGTISGFSGTTTSIGGPPMALLFQHQSGPELRSSMAAFMSFGAAVSLIILSAFGGYGADELRLTALLAPPALAGYVAGRWTTGYLDRGRVRPAILIFSALAATAILIRELIHTI